ncbi:hypothetical protein KR044_002733 [Drosophila immigrans]|nr:hypothetical protein KR044_002733 [Drosophila immigrans]
MAKRPPQPENKSKCKSKYEFRTQSMLQGANVMTVLKTQQSTLAKSKSKTKKPFKLRPKKPQQSVRRSNLMANALLPLMSPQREKPKPTQASPARATQTLLVVRDSVERQQPEISVDKKQRHRLPPMPPMPPLKPKLQMREAGVKATASQSQSQSQGKQPPDVEVPLTTRLPIIDFISTDDFARMHAFKKPKLARRSTNKANDE